MDYALVRSGVVENVIVADADFIAARGAQLADQCVELTTATYIKGQRPGPGWRYNAATKKFSRPAGA